MASQRVREASTRSKLVDDARPGTGRDVVRTVCGREFTIGDLRLEHLVHPAARVSLSTHPLPQDAETLWASLTADEARRLAAHLLSHAAAAGAAPPQSVEVDYVDARQYTVRIRKRHLLVDPLDGPAGQDAAADLLAAAVAVELARRAERFLARHETRREGLRVLAERRHPDEVHAITVTITTPPSLSGERKNALRALLSRSVLRDPPCHRASIEITVS